jgi:hypothetical protein
MASLFFPKRSTAVYGPGRVSIWSVLRTEDVVLQQQIQTVDRQSGHLHRIRDQSYCLGGNKVALGPLQSVKEYVQFHLPEHGFREDLVTAVIVTFSLGTVSFIQSAFLREIFVFFPLNITGPIP